jgi:hypothetical protein
MLGLGTAGPPGLYHWIASDAAIPVNQGLTSASALAAGPSTEGRMQACLGISVYWRPARRNCRMTVFARFGQHLLKARIAPRRPPTARGPTGASPTGAHNLVSPTNLSSSLDDSKPLAKSDLSAAAASRGSRPTGCAGLRRRPSAPRRRSANCWPRSPGRRPR